MWGGEEQEERKEVLRQERCKENRKVYAEKEQEGNEGKVTFRLSVH